MVENLQKKGHMMKTDLRTIKTERDIERGFVELLQKKEFFKVTVEDICTTSLVGRSTFYHHYEDKYNLLEKMVDERTKVFSKLLDERLNQIYQNESLEKLYNELKSDADTIIVLLNIHVPNADLTTRYLSILKKRSEDYLPQISEDISQDFLGEIYATTALTAIKWSLQHGYQREVSNFMNQMVKNVIH